MFIKEEIVRYNDVSEKKTGGVIWILTLYIFTNILH